MRKLILIIFLFFSYTSYSQQIRVVQINAKFNQKNTLYLDNLRGCQYDFGWLEEQGDKLKSQIKSVPVIFIYRDRSLIGRWDGGISLKIDTPVEEIQAVINDLSRYRRVTTN